MDVVVYALIITAVIFTLLLHRWGTLQHEPSDLNAVDRYNDTAKLEREMNAEHTRQNQAAHPRKKNVKKRCKVLRN